MNQRHKVALAWPIHDTESAKDDRFLRVAPVRHPVTGRPYMLGTHLVVGRWPDVFGGAPAWHGVAAYQEGVPVDDLPAAMVSRLRLAVLALVQGVGEGDSVRDTGRLGLHVTRALSPAEVAELPAWYGEIPLRTDPLGPRKPWT